MFDDNQIYSVDFIDSNEEQNELLNTQNATNNPSELIEHSTISEPSTETLTTEETETNSLKRDNVQTPEKTKEETTSTGVSTYTEIPSIDKETIECNNNLISGMDKFNLWLVFAVVLWVLTSLKKRRFSRLIENITTKMTAHAGIFNILLLGLTFGVFLYPTVLGTGISGKFDLFTMAEFATSITANALLLTFLCFKFLRLKKIMFKKAKTFAGINFLRKSLITFSITGCLFFFFTESQIALSLLYFFIMLLSLFLFIPKSTDQILLYQEFCIIALCIQIAILGGLSGFYLLILFGSVIIGCNHTNIKQTIENIKNYNKVME